MFKKCGNCTACCGPSSLGVPDLFDSWERCPHAKPKRCGIYADRPQECREHQCVWTSMPLWPSELRPDRCGFLGIFKEGESEDHFDAIFCEVPPGLKPRLLAKALELVMESCKRAGTTRITLHYGDASRAPKVELDGPFSEFSQRPSQEVALEIMGLWGLDLDPVADPS